MERAVAKMAGSAMSTVAGIAVSRGFAAGPVYLAPVGDRLIVPEYAILEEDIPHERARFRAALSEAQKSLEGISEEIRREGGEDRLLIIASHIELLNDPYICGRIEETISKTRVNAECAVKSTMAECMRVFQKMHNKYMRERAMDIQDVGHRLLSVLMGRDNNPFAKLTSPSIIIAEELSPSDTVALKRDLVLGLATDRGSTTSHVALLARALGIPAVCGLGNITERVNSGDFVLLDGTNGAVTLNPDLATRNAFDRMVERERTLAAFLSEDLADGGALKDGTVLPLLANSQPGVPSDAIRKYGAAGIGLYRTEYLWLNSTREPSEDEQFHVYADAVRQVGALGGDARVVFRTLDLGGDKMPRHAVINEGNPFLGCRSIRWLLAHRDVLRTQIRAILRASAVGKAAIMYPMIADVQELREANEELMAMMRDLQDEGIPFDAAIPHGAMIETPAAALNAVPFAAECDFFSIGTNDLVQYTMAADRGNETVANLYQPANPAVLKLVEMTAAAAKSAGIPCSVCGEAASDPVLGAVMVSLGVTDLSMSAGFIPAQRRIFKALTKDDLDELGAYVRSFYNVRTADEIYDFCRRFLLDRVPRFEDIQSFFTRGVD